MKRAVITLAIDFGPGWYGQGADRLGESLKATGFDGDFICHRQLPAGCPDLHTVPFAFKPWVMMEAAKAGYDQLLWLDASHWAHRSLAPVFDYISHNGHWMIADTSWNCGQWCTDKALEQMGITREQAFGMVMTWAGAIGLDLRRKKSKQWLDEWLRLAYEGGPFVGPGSIAEGFASADSRALGHRHDQTVQAVLCDRLGMKLEVLHACFLQVDSHTDRDDVCILARGGLKGIHWD